MSWLEPHQAHIMPQEELLQQLACKGSDVASGLFEVHHVDLAACRQHALKLLQAGTVQCMALMRHVEW